MNVPILHGTLVRLEPLAQHHAPDLARAADEDRASYDFTVVPGAAVAAAYVAEQLARPGLTPFAQVSTKTGRAVGCTSYCDPRTWPDGDELRAVEIGWTWLAASAQGTGINKEAKLLLMEYAFETLKVARVDFKTDARNERSRRAIAGTGARFEGVLRNWSPSRAPGEDGKLRDSAMFSVTDTEWPAVKERLYQVLSS